jgi:hypothetical protein
VFARNPSKSPLGLAALTAVLILPVLGGCAGTQFAVQSSPGWARANRRVSTFGLKRDGLMMKDGWRALGPEQAPPFGANACDVAYSAQTFSNQADLAGAFDEYTRAHGVTDQLLEAVAPAAQGDSFLFVSISGHPQFSGDSAPPSAAAMGSRGTPNMQVGVFGMERGGASSGSSDGGFIVDAVVFSVADKKSVAELRLRYTGKRIDEAFQMFNQRFESEFPGATCAGWNLDGRVDAASIKNLGTPPKPAAQPAATNP